jgi:TRAP transporter TAXI family solute receptor
MIKKIIIYILSFNLVFCFATTGLAQTIINIATLPIGSYLNVIGNAVAIVVGKHTSMRTTVKPMAGPFAFLPLMKTGEIDLAMINNWDSEKGYLGESVYKKLSEQKGFPIRLIAISENIRVNFVVAADSGIHKCSDLKGKKTAQPLTLPALEAQREALLANCGLKPSDVIPVPVSSVTEGARVVIEGRADASNTFSVGTPSVEELHSKRGARFLPLDPSPEGIKRVKEKFPGYPVKVTPGPGRTGVEEEMYLWAYDIYVIGRQDLPDEIAYQVAKALWENYKELGAFHVLLKSWTPDRFVTKEAIIPYHPGAIKFYIEKGVWAKEMEKLQQELLTKKK